MALNDLAAKLVILGDGAVGKTSLCSNLRNERISGTYELTVGLNIEVHTTQLKDTLVKLVLWDLAGQERWGSVRPAFYYGARVALIVFDLQNRGSFFDVRHWVRELQRHSPNTPFILCGNKRDLRKREVSIEEAEALAQELSAPYYETSALRGENVDELFQKATQMALQGSAVAY